MGQAPAINPGITVDLLSNRLPFKNPSGSKVLEVGCGVGAQTITLAKRSPEASIVAMDISEDSLEVAREKIRSTGFENVEFQQADVYSIPFEPNAYDHVFVCFETDAVHH